MQNACTLLTTVDIILHGLNSVKSRMDTLEDHTSSPEQTGGFGGGGGGGFDQSTAAKKEANKSKWEEAYLRAGGNDNIAKILSRCVGATVGQVANKIKSSQDQYTPLSTSAYIQQFAAPLWLWTCCSASGSMSH